MKFPIYIHRYTLKSLGALNASSTKYHHEGALIKVGEGYGCMHPWPELGDVPLDGLFKVLKEGGTTPTIRAALQCAREDGKAREEGRSLFEGLQVPQSHTTLMMNEADFDKAVAAGFTVVKVKTGRDLEQEREFILAQAERFPELRWRIDFNNLVGRGGIEKFLTSLPESFRKRIDFLEDPCVYERQCWLDLSTRYSIPLAMDRDVESTDRDFRVAILKPAVNVLQRVLEQAYVESWRVVFTSYMDHPLGQTYAAWRAALAAKEYPGMVDTCGLMTHGLFEPNEFIERMGEVTPNFPIPQGTGLGFDDLLENLPWQRLT